MEIRILGPVRLVSGSHTLRIGSFKQRALLAALACRNGTAVSVDQLTETLWEGEPPRSAGKNLQVYVWHLRKLLTQYGAPGRLQYAPPGYQLTLLPEELDLARFDRLARAARAARRDGAPERAAGLFGKALGLWKEEALADLLTVPALRAESVHMQGFRLSVVEDWLDTELIAGQFSRVVHAAEALVRDHPFRERLRKYQIQALYLAGRQGEALAAYDALRRLLRRELGLQPSPALAQLQQRVLEGKPLPGLPLAARDGTPSPAPPGWHRPRPTGQLVSQWGRSLPRTISDFTGRRAQLDATLTALRRPGGGTARCAPPPRLVVVVGPVGGGKTTFAVELAHELEHDCPDGQLYLALRRADGSPREVTEVLTTLLRLTGGGRSPETRDVDELASLFRARVAPLRLLLVLDDAEDEQQLRWLLPGSGRSLTVVTSRAALPGLGSEAVVRIGRFSERAEAVLMLEHIIGAPRVGAEPRAAYDIVDRLDRLPLAIRTAGSRLADRSHLSLREYAERLADPRFLEAELAVGERPLLERFEEVLGRLPGPEAVVLRALGSLQEPATPTRIGWLTQTQDCEAEVLLDRLASRCLIEVTATRPHRYRLFPLLRLVLGERSDRGAPISGGPIEAGTLSTSLAGHRPPPAWARHTAVSQRESRPAS